MSRMTHMALSVDVDRFSDAKLRREFCVPGVFLRGVTPTVEQLRLACYKARLDGLEVFPPCDNTDARGYCKGHEVA